VRLRLRDSLFAMDAPRDQVYAFHEPFAWSTARLLQARSR
jgi:hypothetical protein